jgi:hypothetical protein
MKSFGFDSRYSLPLRYQGIDTVGIQFETLLMVALLSEVFVMVFSSLKVMLVL